MPGENSFSKEGARTMGSRGAKQHIQEARGVGLAGRGEVGRIYGKSVTDTKQEPKIENKKVSEV